MSTLEYDVLMVTDCRFPGGNSSSVVEEITAQHRAGLRTALWHVPSPILKKPRPFSPKIRRALADGLADLVLPCDHVRAALLLARHPTVFSSPPLQMPCVQADEVVLAVNQVPSDERGEAAYYDVRRVDEIMSETFGMRPRWAPIGPRVRDQLLPYSDLVRLDAQDWENIIDVDAWKVPRTGFVGDRPVIGRHSRGHWTKWPDNKPDIVAAYPDDPSFAVSILGGTSAPRRILGGLPGNWTDHPFDSISPQKYLAQIDFFVYFHHHGLIEAFGRVVLEALSAGAVAIVPPYLERLFGDACLYAEPSDVRPLVRDLFDDWNAYAARSARGTALARRRFSYETHVRRISRSLPGLEPRSPVAANATVPTPHSRAASRASSAPTLIVDLTTLGAATPALQLAQRLEGTVTILPAPHYRDGIGLVETLPRSLPRLSAVARDGYVRSRLSQLIDDHHPDLIIYVADRPSHPLALQTTRGVETCVVVPRDVASLPLRQPPSEPASRMVQADLPLGWVVQGPPERPRPVLDAGHVGGRSAVRGPQLDSRPRRLGSRTGSATLLGARRAVAASLRRAKPLARPLVQAARARHLRLIETHADKTGHELREKSQRSFDLAGAGLVTHHAPSRLPTALIVLLDERTAEAHLRSAAQRQLALSSFRLAFLLPVHLERQAACLDVISETYAPLSEWSRLHSFEQWQGYLGNRIGAAARAFAPSSTIVAPADDSDLGPLLDALFTPEETSP